MKLNVGCGNVPLPGYINVDKYFYPGSEHPSLNKEDALSWNDEHYDSPWMYGDALNLSFDTNYFDEVIMVHCLEHLSMEAGNQALKEAIRVLKPGGSLEVEVPDLTVACRLFETVHISEDKDNRDWFRVMGLLYGNTGSEGEGQFHLCGYSKEALEYRLKEQGLKRITEVPVGFGHGTRIGNGKPEPQYDFRLKGFKNEA